MSIRWNTSKTSHRSVTFAFPKVVGYFSLNGQREYCGDLSSLKYLKLSDTINFDLNYGIQNYIKPPTDPREEKLMHLLRFIVDNYPKVRDSEDPARALKFDYACYRGLMTKLMISPYLMEDWVICAIKYMGTIYLCAFDEDKKDYPNQEKFFYWGHKFETYVLAKSPDSDPDFDDPTALNEEFCVMFNTRLNEKRILYGAEMDGVYNTKPLNPDNFIKDAKFIEVKTHRHIFSLGQEKTFRQKTLKWFCQSYLVGVDNVYVGFRNPVGIVDSITKFKVLEMPTRCVGLWDKRDCLKFLDEFMNLVGYAMKNTDDPKVVWRFAYNSKHGYVAANKMDPDPEYQFLPEWYIDFINKQKITKV